MIFRSIPCRPLGTLCGRHPRCHGWVVSQWKYQPIPFCPRPGFRKRCFRSTLNRPTTDFSDCTTPGNCVPSGLPKRLIVPYSIENTRTLPLQSGPYRQVVGMIPTASASFDRPTPWLETVVPPVGTNGRSAQPGHAIMDAEIWQRRLSKRAAGKSIFQGARLCERGCGKKRFLIATDLVE